VTVLYIAAGTLLGLAQLGLGILLGLWIRRSGRLADGGQVDERRARELLAHLSTLASGLSQDVQGHQNEITRLSARLTAPRQGNHTPLTDLVVGVVGEVLRANGHLQRKLSLAESQLQEQSAAIASHLNQAMTDELTGLPNRRAFDDQLRRRLEGHTQHNVPFSILLIDVDYFKRVNDTYGHVAGDRVLCDIAEVLRRAMRKHDLIARYGGEEFAALLPCTSLEDAMYAARYARLAVEAATSRMDGATIRVTASVGLAAAQHGDDLTTIIRRADDALYASKSGGRNCGHFHDGAACIRIPSAADMSERAEAGLADAADESESGEAAWPVPRLSPELATACADLRDCADGCGEPFRIG